MRGFLLDCSLADPRLGVKRAGEVLPGFGAVAVLPIRGVVKGIALRSAGRAAALEHLGTALRRGAMGTVKRGCGGGLGKVESAVMSRLAYERELWGAGTRRVAGVDEAGRGPLAGPVVAAAVILPSAWSEQGIDGGLEGLNDSKQLSAAQREDYFGILVSHPEIEHAITSVSAEMIDQINILQATHRAMNGSLTRLNPVADHVLVDGRAVRSMVFPQTALVRGDSRSYSIAAASVLAKVTRDRAMLEYDRLYPGYGFAEHKGYGTPRHLAALAELGPCAIHRRTFSPMRPVALDLFGDY